MIIKRPDIQLDPNSFSPTSLSKLKWTTTIAIIGFPVLVQILGALMLYRPENFTSTVWVLFSAAMLLVVVCGLYALSRRVFLRFSGAHRGLQEWESKTQKDAFVFSYRVMAKGAILAFIGVSILGALQAMSIVGWIDFSFGQSIALNIEAIAALTIMLAYLTLFLPTLYIAWTIAPLGREDDDMI